MCLLYTWDKHFSLHYSTSALIVSCRYRGAGSDWKSPAQLARECPLPCNLLGHKQLREIHMKHRPLQILHPLIEAFTLKKEKKKTPDSALGSGNNMIREVTFAIQQRHCRPEVYAAKKVQSRLLKDSHLVLSLG